MNTKPSFSYGIKGKLISAVSMLLVAVIMVVSSTYAWFTLSTAPEVTGISTAIGANGALEIRLNDTAANPVDKTNTTWGNIVDLNKTGYGLGDIALLPSKLNILDTGKVDRSNPLLYPQYGADGRPEDDLGKASTGKYVLSNGGAAGSGAFYMMGTGDTHGVLGVGTASGMTERQMAYRNARSAANNAISSATSKVSGSLRTEGGTLAGIVITKMAANSSGDNITDEQVASMWRIVESINEALTYIEYAYEQQIIAIAASEAAGTDEASETLYQTVSAALEAETITLSSIAESKTVMLGTKTVNLEENAPALLNGITHYLALKTEVDETEKLFTEKDLDSNLDGVQSLKNSDNTFNETNWTGIQPVIEKLINYTTEGAVFVNGVDISDLSELTVYKEGENGAQVVETDGKEVFINKIVQDVASGTGINLVLADKSGLYETMADQCGNFDTKIVVDEVTYGSLTVKNLTANMATDSSEAKTNSGQGHLTMASNLVNTAFSMPASSGGADMPLTEFYGYLLDFAFQTNAAGTNLLLQTTPVDRIYNGNTNEETMGRGSNMSFTPVTDKVSIEMVKGLMACVRIVFLDENMEILATARLDSQNATQDATSMAVTADLYLWNEAYELTYTPAGEGAVATKISVYRNGDKYYTDATTQDATTLVNTATGGNYAGGTITDVGTPITERLEAVITALAQNTEKKISTLVYLDGETLTNAAVAYDTAETVTGSLNLQFASSETLTPMEYGGLHQPGTNTDNQTPVPPENGEGTENGTT